MFERFHEPLLSLEAFIWRLLRSFGLALAIVLGALGLGVWGYHQLEGLPWLDALLNAAMILGGMGPVNPLQTPAGKLFASFYALFSGLVFITTTGILTAPIIHRFFHHFHLQLEESDQDGG